MPVPKLHAYPDHYFSAINGLARGIDGRLYFQPLKIFFNAKLLITVMGPTSKALTADAVYRDLTLIRERLDSGGLRPTSAFELVTAIRLQMLRTQESLVTEAAARAAELEKNVMGIDPVKAETVLNDLFSLRHDLQTIRTNAAQTHELYVHLIGTLDSQEGLMPLDVRRLNDLRLGFSHLRNPWISSGRTCRRCSICCRPGQGCSSRAAEVFPQVGVGTNPRRCAGRRSAPRQRGESASGLAAVGRSGRPG
jgi:hypothetical protein